MENYKEEAFSEHALYDCVKDLVMRVDDLETELARVRFLLNAKEEVKT